MEPTIKILIGSPLSGDEASFLGRLYADLAGTEGIILANFYVADQQIDFVVATAARTAAILELKNFRLPIYGHENGGWSFLNAAGKRIPYAGPNPHRQAANQKYALSDRMRRYRQKNPEVPAPSAAQFYKDFGAFVCVFPEIHPESQVISGDNRVAVRSYSKVIEEIRGLRPSTWSLSNWREFAEKDLRLSVATLAEAIDVRVYGAFEKSRAYRSRVKEMFGHNLPPLIGSANDREAGKQLIASTLDGRNHLLVGPSGSAKTFHLHHLAIALADSEMEVPIFIEAKKYRGGDFWTLLKQSTAPLFRGDPRELLEASRLIGALPVLILDALNECSETNLADLILGMQAFVLQFSARAVLTSQHPIELPADLQATSQFLTLPDSVQRRLIYSHHAGLPPTIETERFFEGFTNAYDLTVAGRCYESGSRAASRTDLYDRYIRQRLLRHTSAASAVLRHVASEMGRSFSTAWTRDQFETTAERFLIDSQAPVGILDDIRESRLVDVTEDSFSFEHEILFNYFKADALRRGTAGVAELATELKRPRNHELLELVLPRYSDPLQITALLSTTDDVEVLSGVCRGDCGERPMSVLVDSCVALLDTAVRDVPRVAIGVRTPRGGDPEYLEISGNRDWTDRDAVLCAVIARNLHHPELARGFLKLLDSTEWNLRTAGRAAARSAGFKVGAVWEELVRLYGGVLQHGKLTLPCSAILSALRMTLMGIHPAGSGLLIREALIERTRKNPESHFALLTVLNGRDTACDAEQVVENLQLVEQALKSQVYILQAEALEFLQLMHSTIDEQCREELARVRRMIEAVGRDNLMLNTVIVDTLALYGFLEPVVSAEDALTEVRKLISVAIDDPELTELATMLSMSGTEFLASRAYGCLSRIFEDVFQGAYWEAYSQLSDDEKGRILYLASQSRDRGFSFDWILAELVRYGGPQAIPAFQRFAVGVEDHCFAQEAITCFALGIQGCALHSSSPPPYTVGDSPAHQAWRTIGEILYWRFKGANPLEPRFEELWARFEGPVRLAAADTLYRLCRYLHNSYFRGASEAVDLVAAFPEEIRHIVETCLEHRETLPSVFQYGGSRDRDLIRFLIDLLGKTGASSAIPLLESIVENAEFGTDCIRAITDIQKRAAPPQALKHSGLPHLVRSVQRKDRGT